jgi:hypothetical protein
METDQLSFESNIYKNIMLNNNVNIQINNVNNFNIQEFIKNSNTLKYYYNMSVYYMSLYHSLNNSLNSLLSTSTTNTVDLIPEIKVSRNNPLNSPMDLSIVNNVVVELKIEPQGVNVESTLPLPPLPPLQPPPQEQQQEQQEQQEFNSNNLVCKYLYKRGIKKYTYCGKNISVCSYQTDLCSKHLTSFNYKRGTYKKGLDKQLYDEWYRKRLYKRGTYNKKKQSE